MAWLQRLNDPLRQALAGTLGETYAALLERLGPVAPFELAVLGGRAMATPGLAFLVGGSLLYLLVAPALHLVFRAICKADHNAFRLLFVFVDTKGRSRNGAIWGGSSPTPLPLVRRFRAGDLRHG